MSYFQINKIDAIDSTNVALKLQYQQGKIAHGDLLWAMDQVKGKGQSDRQWISEPKKNLTFSFFLNTKKVALPSIFVLNCGVALAVKNSLISFGLPAVRIKWPNDILSEGKKVCGLLIENLYRGGKHEGSIVGIGLNVNQINFPDLKQASSMQLSSGRSFDLDEVLHVILAQLEDYFTREISIAQTFDAFNASLYALNEKHRFSENGNAFIASVQGVNEQGELILKTSDGNKRNFQNKSIEWIF